MFKQIFIAALLMGALGAVVTTLSSTAQQALADKVGPLGEDAIKQGGLGEFYSKDGKTLYFGVDGKTFGDVRSDIASQSEPGILGSNTAFYGSGECHGPVPDACS
jgi:hypothetical protein